MRRCEMGYEIQEDLIPPERCHCYDVDIPYENCRDCHNYNTDYDLIDRAIESARCRIYRLKANPGNTEAHQKKAENQEEIDGNYY